ncbi:ATP-binding protein [Nonomuraea sp. NPDC026600]|uniref:ATP-binding protein n=1 Tax=Nonomuraea sp. NPDC026600 TaxID=3155363 RepID=UPI0033EB0374
MAAITIPKAFHQAFPGQADQIGAARRWVLEHLPLPDDDPRAHDIALVASELATNAVMHSASGCPAGRFALQIEVEGDSTDQAGALGLTCIDMGPALVSMPRGEGEGGRGLALVQELADAYDVVLTPTCRTVWCRLEWHR